MMFKKLLTVGLLATATLAQAQSNVEIGGRISEYYTNYTSAGSAKVNQVDSNSSYIFLKATEDLGNGVKANVVIDTSIAADNPSTGDATKLGDRQSTIGLSNNFGRFDMGRKDNAMFQYGKSHFDAFAVLPLFSASNKVHNYRSNRLGNGIFVEATPVNGVTLGYQNAQSELANTADTQVYYTVLNPLQNLYVGAFHYTTDGTDKTSLLNAAYTIDATKTRIMAGYSKDKVANVDYKAWNISAVQPVTTRVDFKVGYGQKDVVDSKATTVGFAYNFSKRTAVDVAFQKVTALAVANESQRYGVGLTHKF